MSSQRKSWVSYAALMVALARWSFASTDANLDGLFDVVELDPENITGSCSADDVNCNDVSVSMILENQFNGASSDLDLVHISITPDVEEDSKYVGEWLGDQRHGQGIAIATDGSRYVGRWEFGMRVGWATQTYPEGKYVGDFKNNVRHGMGTFFFTNGDKFYGSWVDDVRTGLGILTLANGDKFMGRWSVDGKYGSGAFVPGSHSIDGGHGDDNGKNGRKRGSGICVYENGDEFVGEWYADPKGSEAAMEVSKGRMKDKANGAVDGECHWAEPTDGAAYGEIMWEGQGVYAWADGRKYVGEYKPYGAHSKMHGQGHMTYADGSQYIGSFEGGERAGDGIYTDSFGRQAIGEWAGDRMIEGSQ